MPSFQSASTRSVLTSFQFRRRVCIGVAIFFFRKKSCALSVSASLEVSKILRSDIDHHKVEVQSYLVLLAAE